MPAATARIVLANCALRWNSPLLFNDPFDVPRELALGVEPKEIAEALAQRLKGIIERLPADTTDFEPGIRVLIETVRSRLTPNLKSELLDALTDEASKSRTPSAAMEEFRTLWRNSLPDLRILCLTEGPAHAAMWYHYADRYRGVVLEFRCVDDLGSAWLLAEPVWYADTKPEVYTADGWAELITMRNDLALQKFHHVATYSKAADWSYEREWRVVDYKRPSETGLFSDRKFDPQNSQASIWGHRLTRLTGMRCAR